MSPSRVVDVGKVIEDRYARSDFSLLQVVEANGRWAVLGDSRSGDSVIVTGDWSTEVTRMQPHRYDAIAMDANGRLYLRRSATHGSSSVFTVLDLAANDTREVKIPYGESEIFLSDEKIMFRTGRGIVGLFGNPWTGLPLERGPGALPPARQKSLETSVVQRKFVLGLPSDRHCEFRCRTETITIFSPEGLVAGTTVAQIDAAYASIGRTVPKPDLRVQGRSRVMWAGTSREGLLYLCLAELPSVGPAYIAVIDPDTGRFVRMLAATLPTSPLRRDRFDPRGVIIPIKGAAHDKLVILDPDAGILSLYE